MEFIELSKENYKDYLPLDIAAFSFAFAGAMGDAGVRHSYVCTQQCS